METLLSALESLLIGIFLAAALILIVASVLLLFFDTDSVKQRKLKQFATAEYKKSRGTIHRQLLEVAAHKINTQLGEYQRQINAAEKQKDLCLEAKERSLRSKLALWIVETRLQEVPGIGEGQKNAIIRTVFTGDLADLKRSYLVQGIGPERQKAIDRWVVQNQAQISYRLNLNRDFPGKESILRDYRQAILALNSVIQLATVAQEPLRERLIPINRELQWLKEVRVEDFFQAYQDPEFDRWDEVDRYLKGIFADWEPMPNWFRAEVGVEAI